VQQAGHDTLVVEYLVHGGAVASVSVGTSKHTNKEQQESAAESAPPSPVKEADQGDHSRSAAKNSKQSLIA
jgi:hypothetical protein